MEATISQSVAILLNPHHSHPACQVGEGPKGNLWGEKHKLNGFLCGFI